MLTITIHPRIAGRLVENLEAAADALCRDPGDVEAWDLAQSCLLAAWLLIAAKAAPLSEPEDLPAAKPAARRGGGGRPKGEPCPWHESGRHRYGDDGHCKYCPAVKRGAAPPADPDAAGEAAAEQVAAGEPS